MIKMRRVARQGPRMSRKQGVAIRLHLSGSLCYNRGMTIDQDQNSLHLFRIFAARRLGKPTSSVVVFHLGLEECTDASSSLAQDKEPRLAWALFTGITASVPDTACAQFENRESETWDGEMARGINSNDRHQVCPHSTMSCTIVAGW